MATMYITQYVWMDGEERIEGKGFNLPCLDFLKGEGKSWGHSYPSKPLIFNSPKLREFGRGGVPLVLNFLSCPFISISLN